MMRASTIAGLPGYGLYGLKGTILRGTIITGGGRVRSRHPHTTASSPVHACPQNTLSGARGGTSMPVRRMFVHMCLRG